MYNECQITRAGLRKYYDSNPFKTGSYVLDSINQAKNLVRQFFGHSWGQTLPYLR